MSVGVRGTARDESEARGQLTPMASAISCGVHVRPSSRGHGTAASSTVATCCSAATLATRWECRDRNRLAIARGVLVARTLQLAAAVRPPPHGGYYLSSDDLG